MTVIQFPLVPLFQLLGTFWSGGALSLEMVAIWSAAGMMLLFVGWILLPRRLQSRSRWVKSDALSGLGRTLGGCVLAAVSALLGQALLTAIGVIPPTRPFSQHGGHHVASGSPLLLGPSWASHAGHSTGPLSGLENFFHPLLVLLYQIPANPLALSVAVVIGGLGGWLSTHARWGLSGLLTWLGLDLLAAGVVGFSLLFLEQTLGTPIVWFALALLAIELFGFLLFLAYQFYTIEYVVGTTEERDAWRDWVARAPDWTPYVAVQVASYNEPAAIVERCLESILRLDYPRDRFVIQLLDDSTDAATVDALGRYCSAHGIAFLHRTHRLGFKAGALNDGLRALPAEVEFIAIVDSDFVVDPRFLRVAVKPFRASNVAFVQTPQAYRNAVRGTFAWWYGLADAYFYHVVQPVRARVQSMIFCGTMGMVRRSALAHVGFWSEKCVTEDAELSIRLIAQGWRGVYLEETLGWGLAPDTMSAVRSQHRRWAFGGMQMLRLNRANLEPERMGHRQRVDFRFSRVFWVDGFFFLGATIALAAFLVSSWYYPWATTQTLSVLGLVVAAPLFLLWDGLFKIRVALRTTTPVSYRDVLGVMGFWYAIKLNDLRAAIRASLGFRLSFIRTPKTPVSGVNRSRAAKAAIRSTLLETVVCLLVVGVLAVTVLRWATVPGVTLPASEGILIGWLSFYAVAFAAAPLFDYYSRVQGTERPGRQEARGARDVAVWT